MKLKLKSFLPLVACLLCIGLAHAEVKHHRPLPASAWSLLDAAPGVRMGGAPGLEANVQVICDANCPYCAKLDRMLRKDHPDIAVRWAPVAYFKPDSAALAAAILSARDPVASLETNYRNYDFTSRRGGYTPPSNRRQHLDAEHAALKQQWVQWGGFTPMIIVRTRDGRILQAMGSGETFVRSVLDQAAPARKVYEAWRPLSSQGD